MRTVVAAGLLVFMVDLARLPASEPVAHVDGSETPIRAHRQDRQLLLHADDCARAFGWIAKVATPGKLLVLCRDEDSGVCVPIRLETVATHATDDGLFVQSGALSRVIGFAVDDSGTDIVLRPGRPVAADDAVDLYHADWGPGRGFDIGQTLPDIPLYDMQGREVRFSQFLGQQCIIYAWASW